jgi:hypothetical protein
MGIPLQTLVEFDIPFAVEIPDGIYPLKLGGKSAEIHVKRIYRKQYGGWSVQGGTAEISLDKHGRFSYSHVILKLPWQADFEETGRKPLFFDAPPRNRLKEISLDLVNRFIDVVRYTTEAYHLEHVTYPDITSYGVAYYDGKQRIPVAQMLLDTGTGGIRVTVGGPEPFPEEQKARIIQLLRDEGDLELSKMFILNAKNAVLEEDFRSATLESVTALEIDLYRFIRKRGSQLKIPQKDLENFIVIVGLTGNLGIVLKMLTDGLEPPDEKLLEICKGAITTRNHILHRGLVQIPVSETELRIEKIESFLVYLRRISNGMKPEQNSN